MTIFKLRNIWEPAELVRFLITANVVMFATAIFILPGTVDTSLNPMQFLAPDYRVLFKLGASGTGPVIWEHRWWSLITANYLHGSLLHLLINVSALRSVGKITINIFKPSRFFLIYFLGGVTSMAASSLAGITLTLGASGAICALIGAMSYDDWRTHKDNLKMRIASVGVWVLFLLLIGFTLPNVNNWAHGVGYASGFFFGFCFWPREFKQRASPEEAAFYRVSASICMLVSIAALIYGLLFS